MTQTDPYEGFHNAVAAEIQRAERKGYSPDHDDEAGLDHLLEVAYDYLKRGQTVKAGVMIFCARAYLERNKKNSMQRDVEKFMIACDQEVKKYPELPSEEVRELRIRLMVTELLGAEVPENFEGPYAELLVKDKSNELVASILRNDLVGIADGIADVLYVVIGTAAAYGIDIQEVFDEVQRSNMSKAVWDGITQSYIVIKENGKVQKPESYSPPAIEPIIEQQILSGRLALTGDVRDA